MKAALSDIDRYIAECEAKAEAQFAALDETALFNQRKVLDAFRSNRIASNHFFPSTGYGYDDVGREKLSKVFADVAKADAAVVSPLLANGTHALTVALFGLLRPGDALLSVTGKPYDTLDSVISGEKVGSLKDFGVSFDKIDLGADGDFDYPAIRAKLSKIAPRVVLAQRSKGYEWRDALGISSLEKAFRLIRELRPDAVIVVDNCYGEFVERREPTEAGADVIAGSLIKNPGGGMAPTGGYIAGRADCVAAISQRLTAPAQGAEVGSWIGGYIPFFQGLFLAPSVVRNALKGGVLFGYALSGLGFETKPEPGAMPKDIIRSVKFDDPKLLVDFCGLIQNASPVDSFATPLPWSMPGYAHDVVMAAGAFVQGASLELSCDGTLKPPYVAYLQGGLTYEHCKIAIAETIRHFNEMPALRRRNGP